MRYVVTFFGRDEKNHRSYLFPEEWVAIVDRDGNTTSYNHGYSRQTILRMVTWLEENPLSRMLKSYGIRWAFTDLAPSSIVIDVESEEAEALDEMLVTLRLFAGRDVRICEPDKLRLRRLPSETNFSTKDRYARG